MQLGHHFGKRKPGWNLFHEKFRHYLESFENTIFKHSVAVATVQFLVLAPLLYWTMENYGLFEQFLPIKTQLKENIISEKKWILFLFFASYCISIFANFQVLKLLLVKNKTELKLKESSDQTFLFDEAADQRRAS